MHHRASHIEPHKSLWASPSEGSFNTYALSVITHYWPNRLIARSLTLLRSNLIPYREIHGDSARTEYDKDLAAIVLADKPDLVVCAGWMSILANTFLDPLAEAHVSIINLHPALPVDCTSFSLSTSRRTDLARDNSMALKPSSEHMQHG